MRSRIWLLALVVFLCALLAGAGEIKLARHPSYQAGKIAFSYLGDIWVVNEDGSSPLRITDNRARDVYPRFSPDGHWIAFSSKRYGNYDVFVVQATGGAPRRLTFNSADDTVVGWSRDGQKVLFQSSRGRMFPGIPSLYEVSVEGGLEQPLPTDWGYWGSYSPDGKQCVFNRHPMVWWRKHYRGSYAADLWIMDVAAKKFRKLVDDAQYNQFWPMWGNKGEIFFVADRLPNEKAVKPGSGEVLKSVNNIWKIAEKGGAPVQVTKHTSGNLYWPSMSADGRVIVYEENSGLWKLDTATGQTREVKIRIDSDAKENSIETLTINSEADSFDPSPSTRRAVISTRGGLFTIATERGDTTRLLESSGARERSPRWSPDGKTIAFVSDRSGREEVWICDPLGQNLKKVSDSDTEKSGGGGRGGESGGVVWAPDSKSLVYAASDRKLYRYLLADGKTETVASNEVSAPRSAAFSPDSKWISYTKMDRNMRPQVFIVPVGGGQERRIADDTVAGESSAAWTRDGKYLLFVSGGGQFGGAAATSSSRSNPELRLLPLQRQEKDPFARDIDDEEAALAAEAADRSRTATGFGARPPADAKPPEVKIDWDGLTRRARTLISLGGMIGDLTPAPDSRTVAFVASSEGEGGRTSQAVYTIGIDGQRMTRVAQAGPRGEEEETPTRGFGFGGLGSLAFSRDGRALFYREGRSIYSIEVGGAGGAERGAPSAAPSAFRGRSAAAATAAAATTAGGAPRRVSFTAVIEVDHDAERKQVFNEAWRVMKFRFYDPKMHGVDWDKMKAAYEPLLQYAADQEEMHNIISEMIGELNASHTGISAGFGARDESAARTRYPGFELQADPSGYYKISYIYKKGPADYEYLKIHAGDFILAVDDKELKVPDNYWKLFTSGTGRKLKFLVNSKPAKEGAWEVRIEPASSTAFATLQYQKWVDDRRAMVDKLSKGEIGYLHIRQMNAESLGQFERELGDNRLKKALIIDQRFNPGGGIDQELLQILQQRQYQYTRSRDSIDVTRPFQAFFGPMVVMQNERSTSDAEVFPQGFKDLKLGKVVGVPTYGAVIGTGAYTLMDGSSIRTPGTGLWTVRGENLENFGVQPDVYVDNTPGDFLAGRDAQLEKAVQVLQDELKKRK
jgi:tricorn protease